MARSLVPVILALVLIVSCGSDEVDGTEAHTEVVAVGADRATWIPDAAVTGAQSGEDGISLVDGAQLIRVDPDAAQPIHRDQLSQILEDEGGPGAAQSGLSGLFGLLGNTVWVASLQPSVLLGVDSGTGDTTVVAGSGLMGPVADGADAVWATQNVHSIAKVDPTSGEVVGSVRVGPVCAIWADNDGVWASVFADTKTSYEGPVVAPTSGFGKVVRLDPETLDVLLEREIRGGEIDGADSAGIPCTLQGDEDSIFVSVADSGSYVAEIDKESGEMLGSLGMPSGCCYALAESDGRLFASQGLGGGDEPILNADASVVIEIDEDLTPSRRFELTGGGFEEPDITGIAVREGSVWVAGYDSGRRESFIVELPRS